MQSLFATPRTAETVQDVEEIFAAQLSPAVDKGTQETLCSQVAAGNHRDLSHAMFQNSQAPGRVAASTPVMRGVDPRELCLEINYPLLVLGGPGTSEEKAASRAAELERVGKEVERLYFRALCKAVRDGRFDARSALGQRCARELRANKELGDTYKQCVGAAAKRAFRQQWAMQQHKTQSQLRLYTEEYKRVDTSKEQYLPSTVLVGRKGFTVGPVGAVKAATCIATLGGNFTDRVEFLRLECHRQEVFATLWWLMRKICTDVPSKTAVNPPQNDERYNSGPSLFVDMPKGYKSGTGEDKRVNDKDARADDDDDNKDTGKGDDCKDKDAGKGDDRKNKAKDCKGKAKRQQVDCLLEKAQKTPKS